MGFRLFGGESRSSSASTTSTSTNTSTSIGDIGVTGANAVDLAAISAANSIEIARQTFSGASNLIKKTAEIDKTSNLTAQVLGVSALNTAQKLAESNATSSGVVASTAQSAINTNESIVTKLIKTSGDVSKSIAQSTTVLADNAIRAAKDTITSAQTGGATAIIKQLAIPIGAVIIALIILRKK